MKCCIILYLTITMPENMWPAPCSDLFEKANVYGRLTGKLAFAITSFKLNFAFL